MDWNMNTEPNEYGKHTSTSSTEFTFGRLVMTELTRLQLMFRWYGDILWAILIFFGLTEDELRMYVSSLKGNIFSFQLMNHVIIVVPSTFGYQKSDFPKPLMAFPWPFFWIRYEKRCIRAGFRYGTISYCSKFHASNSSVEILRFSAPQVAEWYLLQYPCMNALAVAVKSIRGFNSTFGMESTVSIQHYWHHSPCELAWKTR